LSLETNAGNVPSNVVLRSWTLTGLPAFGSTNNTVETVNASLFLPAGQYWIVAQPTGSNTSADWNMAYVVGNEAQSPDGINWHSLSGSGQGAFDVLGSPVPEPATAFLGVVGLGLSAVFRRVWSDSRSRRTGVDR
jgi:hypothetical protein